MPVQSRVETGFFAIVAEPAALLQSRVETGFFVVVADAVTPAQSRVETGFFVVGAEESTGSSVLRMAGDTAGLLAPRLATMEAS